MESDEENVAHFPVDIPLFKQKKNKVTPQVICSTHDFLGGC